MGLMRDERESEIASKFKYGMAGWVENRMRLWDVLHARLEPTCAESDKRACNLI